MQKRGTVLVHCTSPRRYILSTKSRGYWDIKKSKNQNPNLSHKLLLIFNRAICKPVFLLNLRAENWVM